MHGVSVEYDASVEYGVSVEYDASVEYGGCYEGRCCLCTKRTTDKEKRLSEDRSPVNHTYNPSIQQDGTNYTCTYRDI